MFGLAMRHAKGGAMTFSRSMSSGVSLAEEIKEMKKWKRLRGLETNKKKGRIENEMVTFLAIPFCVVKAGYDLSHGAHHPEGAPEYPYLRIRHKAFPWGDDGLFEVKHDH